MNKKVVRWIGLGVGAYAVFAGLVLTYYKDNPGDMHWEDREAFNRKYINKLSPGDKIDKQTILDLLGSPDISEAKTVEDHSYQVLFYRTQHVTSDGITTEDECTPLLLKNGALIAWGESAYSKFKGL